MLWGGGVARGRRGSACGGSVGDGWAGGSLPVGAAGRALQAGEGERPVGESVRGP